MKRENIRCNEDIEIELFINAVYLKYGYDFRDYLRATIKTNIKRKINSLENCDTISDLTYKIIYDEEFSKNLIDELSVNVTEMFRDPMFYKTLREEVLPAFSKYPSVKIWHAGCSTGEEVYSMAMLLLEEGLYDKAKIYATDFNDINLKKAENGEYELETIKEYSKNYQNSGGKRNLSDYYVVKDSYVKLNEEIKKNIIFMNHNLINDGVFDEMNMIICRNVIIYFNEKLQNRALNLFSQSLMADGVLALGSGESINYSSIREYFEDFIGDKKIYRRKEKE